MIRRPPRSTLSPYTTLLPIFDQLAVRRPQRAVGDVDDETGGRGGVAVGCQGPEDGADDEGTDPTHLPFALLTWLPLRARSEEHTSELQSRQYLVCRLLLEKKT